MGRLDLEREKTELQNWFPNLKLWKMKTLVPVDTFKKLVKHHTCFLILRLGKSKMTTQMKITLTTSSCVWKSWMQIYGPEKWKTPPLIEKTQIWFKRIRRLLEILWALLRTGVSGLSNWYYLVLSVITNNKKLTHDADIELDQSLWQQPSVRKLK